MSFSDALSQLSPWICLSIPAVYVVGALSAAASSRPRFAATWGFATPLAFAAFALAAVHAAAGALVSPGHDSVAGFLQLAGSGARALSLRLGTLTSVMLVLITFIGWVVVSFSRRYLDGDPEQRTYLRRLLLTLAAVSGLVMSNSLLVIALLWLGTSLSLHGLLTHYAERPAAQTAAHKKFLLSRLADTCLLGAIALTGCSLQTLELDRIFELVERMPRLPPALALSSVLIAVSVLLKCAQLPFHGWLIQVMEAPTPVSALLHAGVVNIGGFLLIRLAPLMTHAPAAQTLLLVVGVATASVASLVMLTRVSIKVMLAWSTCAQMGMMLIECALGAYEVALLHLVAHSLYKAHAFLGAGGAVAAQRVAAMAPSSERAGLGSVLAAGVLSVALLSAALGLVGLEPFGHPAHWLPVVLLGLALPSLLLRLPRQPGKVLARLASAGLVVVGSFAAGHVAFGKLLGGIPQPAPSPAAAGFAVASFACLFGVHAWLRQKPDSALARWLYPRAFAGFYLDEIFTRTTFRVWPARLPVSPPRALVLSQPQESTSP